MGVQSDIRVLWVNLTASGSGSDALEAFQRLCSVYELYDAGAVVDGLNKGVSLICFEFDFPDIPSLLRLKQTRKEYPNKPILMISQAHSEELAVWALRIRVWEYLVAPVLFNEVELVVAAIRKREASPCVASLGFDESPNCTIPVDYRYRNSNSQKPQLVSALNYVIDHLHEKVKESEVAALCNMSPFKFSRSFKHCYGITFQEYVINLRMEKASQLLANPNVLVADVAYQVGFKDPSYFTRAFKKIKGVSPSDCRGGRVDGIPKENENCVLDVSRSD